MHAFRTATHPDEFRAALSRAHEKLTGTAAPDKMLDVLAAHVSHETASGDKMYNYNFGGIKGRSPDGASARYKTHEHIRGTKTRIVDGFRAYNTIDEGAEDYLRFLEGRYGGAYAKAQSGDVDGFSHALKSKGYYTAPVATYARAVRHHMDNPGAYAGMSSPPRVISPGEITSSGGGRYLYGDELAAEGMTPENMLPDVVNVARIMDSVSGLASRIVAPTEEDTEGAWR